MLRWSSISVVFISIWLRFTRLLLIWICQLLKLLLEMFWLIVLCSTRISWRNLILSPKVLTMRSNSDRWTSIGRSGLIKSYAFLLDDLCWFLILNIQILILLRIIAFLAITNIFLQHIIYISHIIRINLLVVSSDLISQTTKTNRTRWMWSCCTRLIMNTVVSNCIGSLRLRLDRQWCHLTMLSKVWIVLLVPLIIMHFVQGVLIQSIFLLLNAVHSSRTLATTCSRSMISTDLVVGTKWAHNVVLIISKLAGSVNPFLNVCVLTLKFFNFSFDNVLHKVFLLTHILSLNYLISGFVISRLKVERILWIAVKSVVSNNLVTGIRKLRWWLQTDTTRLTAIVEWSWVHFIIKLRRLVCTRMILDSLSTPTV